MEGLTIYKRIVSPAEPGSPSISEAVQSGIVALVFLTLIIVLIPLGLLALLIGFIWQKLFPEPTVPITPRHPVVHVLHDVPNDFFPLRYSYIMGEAISEGAANYFDDDEPLTLYQPVANSDFFRGYFSDFKIEYPTGVFVQKVNFDAALAEVVSMPLYFFHYATGEAEELMDLKGYTLSTKGKHNKFIITATARDDNPEEFPTEVFELEITLADALCSPPKPH